MSDSPALSIMQLSHKSFWCHQQTGTIAVILSYSSTGSAPLTAHVCQEVQLLCLSKISLAGNVLPASSVETVASRRSGAWPNRILGQRYQAGQLAFNQDAWSVIWVQISNAFHVQACRYTGPSLSRYCQLYFPWAAFNATCTMSTQPSQHRGFHKVFGAE